MIQDLRRLVDDYWAWLKDKTHLRQVGQWVEITTPYLDRHNDYIQLFATKKGAAYTLTDHGHTIADLEQSGCKLSSPRRQDLLRMTLNGFGVKLEDNCLVAETSAERFALRKHNLTQAVLAVNDLFYLATPMVNSLFYEDVVAWLDNHDIRYTPKVKFTGKSGYDHLFDFVIPKSRKQPERIIKTITRLNRETAQSVAFSWIDMREIRSTEARAYAIINDSEQNIAAVVLDALRSYDVQPVVWSRREDARDELAA